MTPTESAPGASQTETEWLEGWYAPAKRIASPNFGPRPQGTEISLVVLHSISLPPGNYGGDAVERLFTNRLDWDAHPYFSSIRGLEVSAHFFINREGHITQFVSCDQRAWHAGKSSFQGRDNCNDYTIGIELEGLEGDLFEVAQYQALAVLCTSVRKCYGIARLAGHEHIAPGRKMDPGPGFDWSLLQEKLGWDDPCFPEFVA